MKEWDGNSFGRNEKVSQVHLLNLLGPYPDRQQNGFWSRCGNRRAGAGRAAAEVDCCPLWKPAPAAADRPWTRSCRSYCRKPAQEFTHRRDVHVCCHILGFICETRLVQWIQFSSSTPKVFVHYTTSLITSVIDSLIIDQSNYFNHYFHPWRLRNHYWTNYHETW